ncbi:MAG: O-antigen ligase family protein [Thermoanaerobacteraceae bacterium]|nr:O-antigen ligase family protein [Thermoanaerobacteraceae bacterium]
MEHTKENASYWLAFVLFGLLLFLPAYYRGLFFPVEQSWALLGASVIAAVTYFWKLSRRDLSLGNKMLDYHVLGLLVVYVIAFFGAASPRLAIQEIVKVALYVYVFWLAANLGKDRLKIKYLLNVIYVSAVGVALAGFLTAVEVIHINDGFIRGRVFSTLQYPNATASLLAAVSFIGLYLWYKGNTWQRYLYAAGNYLLLIIFLTTNSRGGFLVYLPAVLFFFVGFKKRWWAVYHWGFAMLGAFVANYKLIPLILEKNYGGAWAWLLLGMLVALVGQAILDAAGKFTDRDRFVAFVSYAVILAVAVAVIFAAGMVLQADKGMLEDNVLSKVLPGNFLTRIKNISLEDRSSLSRLYWMKDSFKLIKEHPLFGLGGGAWESSYRRIQSYGYSSTQVHNHWLQMWTEIGTVGILVLIGIWFYFFYTAWKNYREGDLEVKLLQWALVSAAVMLIVHAFIDFDLALSAVSIVLWSCIGFTRALEKLRLGEPLPISRKKFDSVRMYYVAGVAVFVLATVVLSSTLLLGNSYAQEAVRAFKAKNLDRALINFEKATTFDPWTVNYHLDLAKIYMMQGKKEQGFAEVEKAVGLEKYDPKVWTSAADIMWREGRLQDAVRYMEQARANGPWMKANWDNLLRMYVIGGINLVQRGKLQEAAEFFERAAGMPEEMEKQYESLTETEKRLWVTRTNPRLIPQPFDRLNQGVAEYFLGRWQQAEKHLNAGLKDKEHQWEAYLWLAVLKSNQGQEQKADEYMARAIKLEPRVAKDYDRLKSLPILK